MQLNISSESANASFDQVLLATVKPPKPVTKSKRNRAQPNAELITAKPAENSISTTTLTEPIDTKQKEEMVMKVQKTLIMMWR